MSKREYLFVLIVTFIVIMIWIGAEILHSKPSVPQNPRVAELIEPLDPTFDLELIRQIDSNLQSSTGVILQNTNPSPNPATITGTNESENSDQPIIDAFDDLTSSESAQLDDEINLLD